jgi:AraC-like DNA-binding protein
MFAYAACHSTSARVRPARKRSRPPVLLDGDKSTVVTVVPRDLRSRLDCGTKNVFVNVHVDSLDEAQFALRKHRASAVLISPEAVRDGDFVGVDRLISKSPGVLAVGVLATPADQSAMFVLGASRVSCVIDLSQDGGWDCLRGLSDHLGGEARQRIQESFMDALPTATDEGRAFFGALIRLAPRVSSVRELAAHSHLHASTLTSRFFRAGLPSLKAYLAMTRLAYASAYFEQPGASIAAVAMRLGHSSPQAFGRHVRGLLGLTSGEFRRELSFESTMEQFLGRLVHPYLETFRGFRPLTGPPYQKPSPPLARVAER